MRGGEVRVPAGEVGVEILMDVDRGVVETSFMIPNSTFSFNLNRLAISPQNAANWVVVAAVPTVASPIMLPVVGCLEGLLYLT
jgi:hypothetical protein